MARADDDDYGILTLLVQLDFEPREFFKIPPGCFFPEPDVDSACVVLDRRKQPLLPENLRAAFVKIVKRAFSQRRKMMLKLLKADWPPEKLEAAFAELKISPQERAEKLSLEQFVALAETSQPPRKIEPLNLQFFRFHENQIKVHKPRSAKRAFSMIRSRKPTP